VAGALTVKAESDMGFLDFLFGLRVTRTGDPEELKRLLFEAAQRGDSKRLEKLCRANRNTVLESFAGWQKVPEDVRADAAAMQGYVAGMVAVAETFAQRLGCPELLQRLVGSEQNNPLLRWQNGLRRARELMNDLGYQEACELLSDLLIDVRGLQGSGADTYLPITLGYLGECYFESGEADKALGPHGQALELCQQHGDAEGVLAYLQNLYEAHRYLGQAEPAAARALQLADAMEAQGRADDARRYRRQAEIVRAGEPLNRVVAVVEDRRYEPDEVGPLRDQRVQFVFERNRITLRPAAVLTRRGGQHGSAGRYDEALDAFCAAAAADPFDPHARYQEGLTLLHLQRYVDAVASYEATEELAPGWFHCRTDLWLAQQLVLGNLDHETLLPLHILEDGPMPPEEKVRLAEQALVRTPQLALLHLLRGKNLARLGRPWEAEEAYRQGLACSAEPDVKTRLLAELGVTVQDRAEQIALLRAAEALNGNLTAAATATLLLRTFSSGD